MLREGVYCSYIGISNLSFTEYSACNAIADAQTFCTLLMNSGLFYFFIFIFWLSKFLLFYLLQKLGIMSSLCLASSVTVFGLMASLFWNKEPQAIFSGKSIILAKSSAGT